MNITVSFEQWFASVSRCDPADFQLADAFAIAVCRIEMASTLRAPDPIVSVGNHACSSSRRVTKAMFTRLGYSRDQVRVMQRILGGSPSGWPGLIRLYVSGGNITPAQRSYLRRQLNQFHSPRGQGSRRAACAFDQRNESRSR
jgi:hypothetical protein